MKYMIFNQSKLNKQWEIKALSELGDFTRGKSSHRPRNDPKLFQNGIYPFIQTGDIKEANLYLEHHTENYNEFGLKQSKLWKENTLCITIAANIAETTLLKYPMCFPDSVVGFTAYKGISSELFMHYIFTFIKKSIQSAASGSIQDNINIDFLTKLKFRIPSKAEQDKIAAVLSALDKKIALNKQINVRLEEMAKTLYDYWFVQFDFPDVNGKPYKSSGGDMVFDETLKREIPKGWEVKSLWKVAKYFNGLALQKYRPENEFDDFLPVIKIREMNEGVSLNTERAKTNIPKEAIIDDGDILFSWSATLEIKIWSQGKGALNQHIFKVTSSEYPKYFFYFELLNYLKHFKMIADLRKTTMGHITQDHLKQAYICIPSQLLLEKMERIVTPIFQKMLITQKQNHQLTQLRDFLLPMLMNGQVSVAE
ncbi:restriction endonuclease subunit S [Neisseria sp. RH3002v2f]|uniref:restriction endonuclease subunit S n=1 Tax=Neisseria sp. RH3002v2f TaxID=1871108 RepID=UPI001CB6CBB3|nr:restriction endonuclease subunit S [Neisseria sp. RH3002v2f]